MLQKRPTWYSVFASGPGILGLGSKVQGYDITNPKYTNGGVNHFGSPFNFPEEFVSVYRLHPLVPDLLEYRDLKADPNKIVKRIPVVETFQGKATDFTHSVGPGKLGADTRPAEAGTAHAAQFASISSKPEDGRLDSKTQQIDVVALDIIRDRERGVPRFNEFRRQYGLRQLTSFDDFMDPAAAPGSPEQQSSRTRCRHLREVYGQHVCDASKIITDAQVNEDGSPINDCLGHPNGTLVDNVEDVDTAVGYLAEYPAPAWVSPFPKHSSSSSFSMHRAGFSATGSSLRPSVRSSTTKLGIDWVNNNGPGPASYGNGNPERPCTACIADEAHADAQHPRVGPRSWQNVVNAFDPWARDRGQYYSLAWKPRPGAESDDSFAKP